MQNFLDFDDYNRKTKKMYFHNHDSNKWLFRVEKKINVLPDRDNPAVAHDNCRSAIVQPK